LFGNRRLPQTTCADCAGCSGAFLTPSPPAKKATASEDQALPYAQPRRPRQLDKALSVFPHAQCGHGCVWHRGKLLITLAQQLAHAVNAAQRRPLLHRPGKDVGLVAYQRLLLENRPAASRQGEKNTASQDQGPLLGDELTTASRQGQKNTASQDQARQSSTDHGTGNGRGECRITSRQDLEASAGASSEGEVWPREARTRNRADGSV
jgi:hypothetical protein